MVLVCVMAFSAPTTAAGEPTSGTRAAFLALIERPRVSLAVETRTLAPTGPQTLAETEFSYASDATNRVPGLLVHPAAGNRAAVPRGRHPVVINLHGTGGNKDGQRKLLHELAGLGFVAVAIDGRYHGDRAAGGKAAKASDYIAAIARAFAEPGREYPFYYDTAWDVMRLIDYRVTRDDVDPARIAIWGFSKGGTEAYLAAAADPRIAAVVPCIGVQSFAWALEHEAWQARIGTIQSAFDAARQHAGVTTADAAFVRRFYDRVAPGLYDRFDGPAMLPLIAPRPLLVINGETDPRTPVPGVELCAAAARSAYRASGRETHVTFVVQPKVGHQVTPESMSRIKAWLVEHLQP
jgi:dienelactone hydrolase